MCSVSHFKDPSVKAEFTPEERELAKRLVTKIAYGFSAITGMSFRDINRLFREILEIDVTV